MSQRGRLIVIGGPTASGKTATAVQVAKQLNTEVISADSRQFYREMCIGTTRPTAEEMDGVPHHFVGHLSIHEPLSAGSYAEQALPVILGLLKEQGVAVITGGSGLYLDAVCYGFDHLPPADQGLRERLQKRVDDEGLPALVSELEKLDPDLMTDLDRNNPHRVIRALEVCMLSGKPFSEQRTGRKARPEFQLVKYAIDIDREELYARIEQRVDRMMEEGLLEEVRSLLPYRDLPTLRTVGYTELFDHLDGKCSLAHATDKIKQHTRNYAKRQLTWMRKDKEWRWMSSEELLQPEDRS